jgi:hypothetical protein
MLLSLIPSSWLSYSCEELCLSQALQNPRASAALNEWLDAKLDAKFRLFDEKLEARFAQIRDCEKSALLDMSKSANELQAKKIANLEVVISEQSVRLQEMQGVVAVNKYLETHNAELKRKVEQLERVFFKGVSDAGADA